MQGETRSAKNTGESTHAPAATVAANLPFLLAPQSTSGAGGVLTPGRGSTSDYTRTSLVTPFVNASTGHRTPSGVGTQALEPRNGDTRMHAETRLDQK